MGLGARWQEIATTYAEVNFAFGDIVKVTPSSKVVGDMAIFLVSHDMKVSDLERLGPGHNLTLPNSVVEMFAGALGEPEGGWPRQIQSVILRGAKPTPGRPADHLAPVDFEQTLAAAEKKTEQKISHADLMSYLMYPDVFVKFAKARSSYGSLEVLPTPEFFYGLEQGREIAVELEPGKTLVVKLLTVSDAHPDGTRTIFFELNGQPREVTIRDNSLRATVQARPKADSSEPGQVGAPIPGIQTCPPWEWPESWRSTGVSEVSSAKSGSWASRIVSSGAGIFSSASAMSGRPSRTSSIPASQIRSFPRSSGTA